MAGTVRKGNWQVDGKTGKRIRKAGGVTTVGKGKVNIADNIKDGSNAVKKAMADAQKRRNKGRIKLPKLG